MGEIIMIYIYSYFPIYNVNPFLNKQKKVARYVTSLQSHVRKKNPPCLVKILKFQLMAMLLTIREHMPLGNLSPGEVTDLLPVFPTGSFCRCTQDQPPNYLILGPPFGIQNKKFDTYIFKALTRNIKDKQFIEYCIGGALLHMSLLFGDSLFGMVQVHFDVGI